MGVKGTLRSSLWSLSLTDEVRIQEGPEDLLALGDGAEDLGRREGGVEEDSTPVSEAEGEDE